MNNIIIDGKTNIPLDYVFRGLALIFEKYPESFENKGFNKELLNTERFIIRFASYGEVEFLIYSLKKSVKVYSKKVHEMDDE